MPGTVFTAFSHALILMKSILSIYYKIVIFGSEKLTYPKKPSYSYQARVCTQVCLTTKFMLFLLISLVTDHEHNS